MMSCSRGRVCSDLCTRRANGVVPLADDLVGQGLDEVDAKGSTAGIDAQGGDFWRDQFGGWRPGG